MKIEVEVKHKPRKNDIIVFDGEKWSLIDCNQLTKRIEDTMKIHEERISTLEGDIKEIKGE